MAFDYSKLKGRIVEKYGTQACFAKKIGISSNTLSLKMNNKIRFTSDDVIKISELLGIKRQEIDEYFFVVEFQK